MRKGSSKFQRRLFRWHGTLYSNSMHTCLLQVFCLYADTNLQACVSYTPSLCQLYLSSSSFCLKQTWIASLVSSILKEVDGYIIICCPAVQTFHLNLFLSSCASLLSNIIFSHTWLISLFKISLGWPHTNEKADSLVLKASIIETLKLGRTNILRAIWGSMMSSEIYWSNKGHNDEQWNIQWAIREIWWAVKCTAGNMISSEIYWVK